MESDQKRGSQTRPLGVGPAMQHSEDEFGVPLIGYAGFNQPTNSRRR